MSSRIVAAPLAVALAAGVLAFAPTAASAAGPIMCSKAVKAKYDTNLRLKANTGSTSVGTFKKGTQLCAQRVVTGGYHAHCGGDKRWTIVFTISGGKAHQRYVATGCVSRIFNV